jgi:hypothetical protein
VEVGYDKDGALRNFTRFVYSDYIADWVEQTISDNEATSETEEGPEEASASFGMMTGIHTLSAFVVGILIAKTLSFT